MTNTPCIVIDQSVMNRNLRKMAAMAERQGVALRPHIKTHKIPAFAAEQIRLGAAGVTAAKVSEAEVMAEGGIRDIFIAYPIVAPDAVKRAVALAKRVELSVGVDSVEGAERLSAAAEAAGNRLRVRLELDTGLRRTGVEPEEAVRTGLAVAGLPGLELDGVFTYKGAVCGGAATLDFSAAGREEGELAVRAAEELRAAGIAIRHVSVGSTPTSAYAAGVPGVTEVRPGTYIFNDRMMLRMGVCGIEDCAAKVVATVVSTPSPQRAVIDGGSKTFATDVQPGQPPLFMKGFGEIVGHPDAVLERMNEEHGMIVVPGGHGWKVGDTLSIIPNHICSTVNLHNTVMLEDGVSRREIAVSARGKLN